MKPNILVMIVIVIASMAISCGIVVGIIKLITLCFGWEFSLPVATGIWLIMMLAKMVFSGFKKD